MNYLQKKNSVSISIYIDIKIMTMYSAVKISVRFGFVIFCFYLLFIL